MKKVFFIAILSMFLMNCSDDDNGSFTSQNIDFTTIGQGTMLSTMTVEEQNTVIINQADWNQLVELFSEDYSTGAEEFPEIDFNTFQVIVSVDDIRGNTGFWLEITDITENENNITVTTATGGGEAGFDALSRPFHIVKIPKSDKPVVFESNNQNSTNSFNAKVLYQGADCGDTFLIQFDENVSNVPNNNTNNIFYALNLDEQYKVEGLDINVDFREPYDEEIMACTTAGVGFPQIFIEQVNE